MIRIILEFLIKMDRSDTYSKSIGITLVNCYLKVIWILYCMTVVHVICIA